MSKDVVIVSAVRTPIGSFLGSLSNISAVDLGAISISGALNRINLSPESVDEVIFGNYYYAIDIKSSSVQLLSNKYLGNTGKTNYYKSNI